jgi:hypothetical protein
MDQWQSSKGEIHNPHVSIYAVATDVCNRYEFAAEIMYPITTCLCKPFS